jgi:hypothetical protein
MVIFCSKCGVKNSSEDKFCKDCGTKLAGSAEAPKEEAKSKQTSAPAPAPVTPVKISTKTKVHAVVQACVSLFFLGLFGYLAWYLLGCSQGKYLGNGDVACQSIYQSFNGGSSPVPGGNTNGGSNPSCSNRCPAYAPWYCTGQYYDADNIQRSLNGCLPTTAPQAGYSSWSGRCTKCP